MYSSLLSNNSHCRIIFNDINHTAPWFIELIAEKRDELMKYLEKNHIGTRPMYPPINKQKAYNDRQKMRDQLAFFVLNCDSYDLMKLYDEFKRLKRDKTIK